MKKYLFGLIGLFISSNAIAQTSYADIVESVMPSVVSVSVVQNVKQNTIPSMPQFPPGSPFEKFFKDFSPRNNNQAINKATSVGSGFIIGAEGIVMTNAHVIENAQSLNIIFHDGASAKASILNIDKKTDIALLKVETERVLKPITFGNSDNVRVGDKILAIGNPFGLGSTVTSGIISARARDIQAGPYDDFLQTDAPINRGNSGGPMFNLNGEVIGINTAIFSPSGGSVGIGFAIPSNMAKMIFENLMKHGKIRRGQIGVKVQSVTEEIAQSLGMNSAKGAMIAGINEKGPAAKAGLKIGDVILSIDGNEIESMRKLPKIVAQSPIGKSIDVIIWRGGKEQNISIIIEEMAENPKEIAQNNLETDTTPTNTDDLELNELGITIVNVTDETRQKYKLSDNTKGVIITNVTPNSEAEAKGLQIGDIIVEVKQTPIIKTSDVEALIKAAINQNLKSILMLINSDEGLNFIALRLK